MLNEIEKLSPGEALEYINRRRRQILVHSYLYYQLNENIVTDETFDKWSRELVALQEAFPEVAKKAEYAKGFEAFDGSTGFDLPFSDPTIQNVGNRLLRYHKKGR